MRSVTPLTPPWLGFDEYFVISYYMYMYVYILLFMVYIKIAKSPFLTHGSNGTFDTIEVLQKPPPRRPPPALPLPVHPGAQNYARSCTAATPSFFFFFSLLPL